MGTLQEALSARAAPAAPALVRPEKNGALRCLACGHRCVIPPGRAGVCLVRENRNGTLYVPRGYVAGLQDDPVEKKPFFHVLPGARALSFGMLGCDLKCPYCQNWITSQALRDPAALSPPRDVTPEEIVEVARGRGCRILTSTYNEPLITSEWAMEVFRTGHAEGFLTSYVSNGNATPEVLEYIRPHTDLYKIDFKGWRQKAYSTLGGSVERVKESIRRVFEMGFHLEIVTLVVPGVSDDPEDHARMAEFLAEISTEIPWHLTAFHSDYKMEDVASTRPEALLAAHAVARAAGMKYVYCGNRPGEVGETENTICPGCGGTLVRRIHFRVVENRMHGPACPDCGQGVPGIWTREA